MVYKRIRSENFYIILPQVLDFVFYFIFSMDIDQSGVFPYISLVRKIVYSSEVGLEKITRVGMKKMTCLCSYMFAFIDFFSPIAWEFMLLLIICVYYVLQSFEKI